MVTLSRAALLLPALVAMGCSSPVQTEVRPEASEQRIRKVALVALRSRAAVATEAPHAAALVTARVLRALTEAGAFEVVPPQEVARVLEPDDRAPARPSVGRTLAEAFGVSAVLTGEVRRFTARSGSARGSTRPAAVAFDLLLRTPDGLVVWSGSYEESQRPLTEDLSSLPRAFERRFRFVTAEALADYGARRLVAELSEVDAWR